MVTLPIPGDGSRGGPAILDTAQRVLDLASRATPGEWRVTEDSRATRRVCIVGDGGVYRVETTGAYRSMPDEDADFIAATRAAAPELAEWVRKVDAETRGLLVHYIKAQSDDRGMKREIAVAICTLLRSLRTSLGLPEVTP